MIVRHQEMRQTFYALLRNMSLSVFIGLLGSPIANAHGRPNLAMPWLAPPEGTPEQTAGCHDLQTIVRDFHRPLWERVDLWVSGPVTILDTDRVLWYVGVCDVPGVRVLCVTYSDNDVKLGDVATLRGAMRIQDPYHIVLDPCLASRD
nr:hypothetical protein REQ54_03884 [Rhizobium sp. Q54]